MQGTQSDVISGSADRLQNTALLRRIAAAATANDAMDVFLHEAGDIQASGPPEGFTEVVYSPACSCGLMLLAA